MAENVETPAIDRAIRYRRTIKPERFNGKTIPDSDIHELLELADCAPTHARTEPWRFVVYGPETAARFGVEHAELYRAHTASHSFAQPKYDNIKRQGENSSHVIVVSMRRVPSHKIPEMEEIAAVSAAVQNILVGAAARGIATFWSTGGMALHPAFHQHFRLGTEDLIIGILYLGYSDEAPALPIRMTPLADKIEWVR